MNRWLYPVLGMIILTMLGGIYTFSLFYHPLQQHYGISSVAPFTLAFSLITLTYSIFIIPAGIIYDRLGPRIPLIAGAFVIFSGYLLASQMKLFEWDVARIQYYVGLGILPGLGIALVDAVPRPLASKWFLDRPGTAIGLVAVGFGIGAAVMTPVITYLLESYGVFRAFALIGLLYFGVIVLCSLPMRDPPVKRGEESLDFSLGMVARDIRFYRLWFAFFLSSFAGLMVIGNAAPILRKGAEKVPELAGLVALFLIVTSLANAGGRFAWGVVLDRLGVFRALRLNFVLSAIASILLAYLYSSYLVFPLASVVYANYGGVLAMFPAAVSIYFGKKYAGRIYGAIFTAWGFSGLLAPYVGGLIRDMTGEYVYAFYLALTACVVAILTLKDTG
ncbi:Nitrate/nitrite transporter [Geoglobus ahangari]|uniref:Nitrate/nitrite transporter n=1 Tax=Geoglobus ahangari TaxID=113653 RepID=A0A0F7IEW9_9EURY|nr:MFS transporter [Geoglobus ahangari]AKG92152.1 Nitrate/nitrite transporter [Geoglobus ahangari]